MVAKKGASSKKDRPAQKTKPTSTKQARHSRRRVRKITKRTPKIETQGTSTRQERKGREALRESKEEHELQQEFFAHQQLFRQAVEESANLLRQAAQAALQSISEQTAGSVPQSREPSATNEPNVPLKPFTAEFVDNAYKRAKEMFAELDPAGARVGPATSQTPVPVPVPVPVAVPAIFPLPDVLAATATLMSQATQYLNVATQTMMHELDGRLSAEAANKRTQPVTPPSRKRKP
ncbi:MAG: hypothetical protein QOF62_1506 [Pyrinomonadaceae bacterium]|jgi:hypothetical protein|nr:hypothetical protein [Pyrinomonadaceae bacterium]